MGIIRIGDRWVGEGQAVYVIAELSANHHQDYEAAQRLIREAQQAGADAVKTQAYDADCMCWPNAAIQWHGQNLYDLYRRAATPWEWHQPLKQYAESLGIQYFASVFDQRGVDLMDSLGVAAHKIASFELVDSPLLRAVGKTRTTVIMSTGMAEQWEISYALEELHEGRRDNVYLEENRVLAPRPSVALLKCTSAYPAGGADANLLTIASMRRRFGCPIGLSDHTMGIAVPVAAVALGACIVEKHLTGDRAGGGPDAAFSLEPPEFRQMVEAIRVAERALGKVQYGPTEAEEESLLLRRSLWVVNDIRAGDVFTAQNVRSLRPAHGLAPRYMGQVLGKLATEDVAAGTPLGWEMVGSVRA